jgi:ribosomal protein S12 methylthiotransferase
VKELNLISQDTTYYGLDLRPARTGSLAAPARFRAAAQALPTGATTLVSLLRELNELPGDFWVRLLYTHPAHWTDELIAAIAECPKVARYVDMPLQHIHEVMLERMRRETSRAYIEDLIGRIRAGIPGIALRTTFIVGFPGETEACFESLLDFIRATKFDRLGVFTYSPEAGTRAAAMAGPVPETERAQRRDRAMAAQLEIARALNRAQVGRSLRVLVEGEADPRDGSAADVRSWEHGLIRSEQARGKRLTGRTFVARSEADAPDIDGRVYVRGRVTPGTFAQVRVVEATDYDLVAVPSTSPRPR